MQVNKNNFLIISNLLGFNCDQIKINNNKTIFKMIFQYRLLTDLHLYELYLNKFLLIKTTLFCKILYENKIIAIEII